MKQIQLTQGKVTLVDDSDYEHLNSFKWCAHKGGKTFYAVRNSKTINRKQKEIRMHREIMNPATGMQIDHVDHNGLNNQKANLRIVTNQQNQMNRRLYRNTSSFFKGVSWSKRDKLWKAEIRYNYKHIHLGYFEDELDAALVYNQAAIKLFRQYAYLNPIPVKYKNKIPVKYKVKTTSKFAGVHWRKSSQKWVAQIQKNGKQCYLGCFDNEVNAHQAYLKAKQNL